MISGKHLLIIGATSSIARAIALNFAKKNYSIFLAGRDIHELNIIAEDIKIRYQTNVFTGYIDSEDIEGHHFFIKTVLTKMPVIDGVIFAAGTMTPPAQKILMTNFNGAVSLLEIIAEYLQEKKSGFMIGISSVAGDRGRQSNYLYGAAKGGFSLYLQGLRNRLFKSGVKVITVKLGFVDTAMTFGLPGLFFTASPEEIARKLIHQLDSAFLAPTIIYLPWFWRYIMLVIRLIPEQIFKRLSL